MSIQKGDETILANNLYLEILAGSGLPGLAAFLWFLAELGLRIGRSWTRPAAAARMPLWFVTVWLLSFLAHGAVDYFLKFTPTFLLFWILAGLACAIGREEGRDAGRI